MDAWEKQLADVTQRKQMLEEQLSDPDLVRDPKKYAEVTRAHREVNELFDAFSKHQQLARQLREAKEMADDSDPEMAEMAKLEIEEAQQALETIEHEIRVLLLPRDPNDGRNVIVEIRAGTGGDESALFAGDLLRMYMRYAEQLGWKIELLSSSESDLGGFKEVIFSVIGEGVYSRLKYEGGGHRVQRVPATETQGRIHTSAATVAVMPEADEVDVEIKAEELKIDVYRSSGPGGQSVNTTDSAVRITHLPTGLVVTCQDEKSQHKNKAKAIKVLRTRLYEAAQQEHNAEISAQRKAQVGSGDRSQRIRTYNFPQNRLSDHRINLTIYSLDHVMEGQLDLVLDPLIKHAQDEMLKGL